MVYHWVVIIIILYLPIFQKCHQELHLLYVNGHATLWSCSLKELLIKAWTMDAPIQKEILQVIEQRFFWFV